MAISDYSTTAASNTAISGIDISGATGKVKDGDNAIRQLMADIKAGVPYLSGTSVVLPAGATAGISFSIAAAGTIATFTSTDAGATIGPVLALERNSASPAASDLLGRLSFLGQDSGGGSDRYGGVEAVILDPTNGSEDGAIDIYTLVAGAQVQIGRFGSSAILRGTPTNDDAATGFIGEHVASSVASGSAVSLTTATPANVTSISLTAGDWEISGKVAFSTAASTNVSKIFASINDTSATISTLQAEIQSTGGIVPGNSVNAFVPNIAPLRYSLGSTTTIYLVAQATFTVSTLAAYGAIRAVRVR